MLTNAVVARSDDPTMKIFRNGGALLAEDVIMIQG